MSDKKDGLTEEFSQWVEPSDWVYNASTRQTVFRTIARELVDGGHLFRKDWFKCSRTDGRMKSGVTLSEWNSWCNDGRFVGWFYEDFPEAVPISKEEYALMDSVWIDGVLDSMRSGEDWAYKLYANVRFKNERKREVNEESRELRSYLNETSGSRWRSPTAEA